jgi:hypothetical protein
MSNAPRYAHSSTPDASAGDGQERSSTGRSGLTHRPGAEAVSGISISPDPLQQAASGNSTVLGTAQAVSANENRESGPLVRATLTEEDQNRRDIRRLYVFSCSAILWCLLA